MNTFQLIAFNQKDIFITSAAIFIHITSIVAYHYK